MAQKISISELLKLFLQAIDFLPCTRISHPQERHRKESPCRGRSRPAADGMIDKLVYELPSEGDNNMG